MILTDGKSDLRNFLAESLRTSLSSTEYRVSHSIDVFAAGVCPITVSMVESVLNPGAPSAVTALVQDTPERPATTVSHSNTH